MADPGCEIYATGIFLYLHESPLYLLGNDHGLIGQKARGGMSVNVLSRPLTVPCNCFSLAFQLSIRV